MAQYVEVKGNVIEFPDGMSSGDIEKAIKANMLSVPAASSNPLKDAASKIVAGNTGTDNFLAGVGGGMTSMYLGAKQMGAQALDYVLPREQTSSSVATGKASSRADEVQREIDSHKQIMSALKKSTAGTVGNFVGEGALMAPAAFLPGANTYLVSTGIGALTGALQPTSGNESRLMNTGVGAVGGAAGKWVGDQFLGLLTGSNGANSAANAAASTTPSFSSASSKVSGSVNVKGGGYNFGSVGDDVSAGLTRSQSEIMKTGQGMGFKVTPGQASGSRSLQQLEAKLESQPMTSGRFNQIKANNQDVLNRVAANAIGENANTLDHHVLQQAQERIGGIYKMVADKTPRTIETDPFINRLSAIENDFEGLLPGSVLDNPLTKRLFGYAANGKATGEQLQDLASKLGKAASNQMTTANGDRQLGMALFQVKDMADDLLSSGLKGSTKEAFDNARGQYRNLMLLTQRNGVINPSTGNINGNALAGLLQQKDRNGFLFGKNTSDLYEAARFAQAFRPIVGDSGTATRMPLPTDFVLSLPFNLATKAYTSAPAVNLAVNASSLAKNGVAPGVGKAVRPYLSKATAISGGLLATPSN